MSLEIIRDKNRWIDALDEIKKFDPCHRYSFHNAYKYHMDAKDLLMIRIQQGEKLILYPMIIFPIPDTFQGKTYSYATSAYGFTGFLNNYSGEFLRIGFQEIDNWLLKNNIIAEFIRFSPFTFNSMNKIESFGYKLSINRKLSIWNTSLIENPEDESHYSCNMSRRAKKLGAVFREIKINEFPKFKDLYDKTMRINNAEKFFEYSSIYYKTLLDKKEINNNHFYGVFKDNELISAAWFISNKETAYYHLGCSVRKIPGSSDYVLRESLKLLVKKGIKKVNLTGGRTTDERDPLLKFKKRIGNSTVDYFVATRSLNLPLYRKIKDQYLTKFRIKDTQKFIPWS